MTAPVRRPSPYTRRAAGWLDAIARVFVICVLTWWVLDAIKDRYGSWICYGFGAAVAAICAVSLLFPDDTEPQP